jgi:dienelactone hydrolase
MKRTADWQVLVAATVFMLVGCSSASPTANGSRSTPLSFPAAPVPAPTPATSPTTALTTLEASTTTPRPDSPAPDSTTSVSTAPLPTGPASTAPDSPTSVAIAPLGDASPGPYPVGHTTLHVPASGTEPALTVDVWYPAATTGGAHTRYVLIPGVGGDSRLAFDDLPGRPGSYPLVLYSHGGGGIRFVATFFTEVLASHGYVVAAPDHPGDTIIDAFVRQASGAPDDTSTERYRLLALNRTAALRRTLKAVEDVADPATSQFADLIDPARVALAGHSLGGSGVLAAAGLDPRFGAVIAMDPTPVLTTDELAAVHVPVLALWGMAHTEFGNETIDAAGKGPTYRVVIPDADHIGFTDTCSYEALLPGWLAAGAPPAIRTFLEGDGQKPGVFETSCRPPRLPSSRVQDLTDGYSLAFLRLVFDNDRSMVATMAQPQPDAHVELARGT